MCQSIACGGKRCANDTRRGFESVLTLLRNDSDAFMSVSSDQAAAAAVRDHASTKTGMAEVQAAIAEFEAQGATGMAAFLTTQAKHGAARAEADVDFAARLRSAETERAEQAQQVLAEVSASTKTTSGRLRMARLGEDPYAVVLTRYAETNDGRKHIEQVLDALRSKTVFEQDRPLITWLEGAVQRGQDTAAARAEQEKIARAAESKKRAAERAEQRRQLGLDPKSNWKMMQPSKQVADGTTRSAAEVHPNLVKEWSPRNPCTPDQVAYGSSTEVLWRCPTCEHEWATQLGNRLRNRGPNGEYSSGCPACTNRSRFRKSRDRLADMVAALRADPDALDALPPAVRESVLLEMGFNRGSDDDKFNSLVMRGLVNGDISIRDVLRAEDQDAVLARMDLSDKDEDRTNRTLTAEELARLTGADADSDGTLGERVDRLMAAADFAAVSRNEALVEAIVTNSIRGLWNEVHNNPGAAEEILERVTSDQGRADMGPFRTAVAERFAAELLQAQSYQMPEGYSAVKTLPDGRQVTIEPYLTQKAFALMVAQNRRVGNWSGTGAGKTLSGVLAAREVGAQETVVVGPLSVCGQWADEFAERFPDTDVRFGLPPAGEDLAATHTGRPRVWVVNYEQWSGDEDEVNARLAQLAPRLDMAILDETHKAKQRGDVDPSKRRLMLAKFLKTAGKNKPDLAVIGATATPVVNDLNEAKSLLELIEGRPNNRFATEPTKRNALAAHREMLRIGVRYMPAYPTKIERTERVIPLDRDAIREVGRTWNRLRGAGVGGRSDNAPARMERALLAAKMPALLEEVRSAPGPVVIYSYYKDGIVDEITSRLSAEQVGAVARFTGNETPAQRKDILDRFRRGEIKALVGTSPIATGVDGLQSVCNRMVIVSSPETAAEEDQLLGRLQRTGQERDVKVTHLVTEAKFGEITWSHDRTRNLRVSFKRGLGEAVTDGVIPQGHAQSEKDLMAASVAAMQRLLAEVDSELAQSA